MEPESPERAKRTGGVPLRLVAIGGGTGLSTLLKGLKRYVAASSGPRVALPGEPAI